MTINYKMPIVFNMKKRQLNTEIIRSQKSEIRNICAHYAISTTELARKANIAPSTVNRFMKAEPPNNALSAITLEAIRSVWPIQDDVVDDQNTGILDAIKIIIAIITARNLIKDDELESLFSHQLKSYRMQNQPNAIVVMERLIASLGLKPTESKIQAIRKLLPPHQAG